MEESKPVTAMIVCCYGNYDRTLRQPAEMDGYKQYLYGIVSGIRQRRPDYVVLCGGYTNSETESEAASVLRTLRGMENLSDNYRLPSETVFLLEERSLSTPQNIRLGIDRLISEGTRLDLLTIVTDRLRRPKARVLMFRLTDLPREFVGIDRPDIHPNSRRWVQLAKALQYLFMPMKKLFPSPSRVPH